MCSPAKSLCPEVISVLVISSVALPVFEMFSVFGREVVETCWLPKPMLVTLNVTVGLEASAMPFSVTICSTSGASSVNTIVVVRVPDALGWKLASWVQDRPAPRVNGAAPQVPFTRLKSPVLPPVLVTLETFNVAVPVLVMVSVILAEVLPTMVDGKFSVTALRATCGLEARPVPLSATTGLPPSSVEVRLPLFAPADPGAKRHRYRA
jgi:hypothetical protein